MTTTNNKQIGCGSLVASRNRGRRRSIGAVAILAGMAWCVSARAATEYYVANPIDWAHECACATSTAASGCGAFTLDTVTRTVSYYIRHNLATENASHVHGPAGPCPAVAGVVQGLPLGAVKIGSYVLTAAQMGNMQADLHYVNMHDATCGGGRIRGQITKILTTEACCLPSAPGGCLDTDSATCICLGGVPQGPGTSCATVDCMQACCGPIGGSGPTTCYMTDPATCTNNSGTPQGNGTQCTASEACCLSLGGCIEVDPICCDDMGGVPQGPGTNCGMVICQQPTEACCLPDGTCQDATIVDCLEFLHGRLQGPGTLCSQTQCYQNWVIADDFRISQTCPQCKCDVNGDTFCDNADITFVNDCIAFPGGPGCASADVDCDGVVSPNDLAIVQCLVAGNPPDVCCPLQPNPPVHRIRWYGSYLDSDFEPPNNTRNVEGWLVAIHRDIPAQPCPPVPTGLTPIDLCGQVVVNPNCPPSNLTFTPDGSVFSYTLSGLPIPPGQWRICGYIDPNCPTCPGTIACIVVLQVLPCDTVSRPGEMILQYAFNPIAVSVLNVGKIGCDNHLIFCYIADLASGCLAHNSAGIDEIDLTTGAFKPRPGVVYWMSVQAEVGRVYVPGPGLQCTETFTGQYVQRDFWGWHTTPPGYQHLDDAYMGTLGMGCFGEWLYKWMNHLHWSHPPYDVCADDLTKSMDMAFYLSHLNPVGGEELLWIQPVNPGPPPPSDPPWTPRKFPPGGIDEFPQTTAQVTVNLVNPPLGTVALTLNGPTVVSRKPSFPSGAIDIIDTEIIAMSLTGISPGGPTSMTESGTNASTGQTKGNSVDVFPTTDSFFDVFVDLDIPGMGLFMTTQGPVHVDSSGPLHEVPPSGASYGGPPSPVPLVDRANPSIVRGFILRVDHFVGTYRGGIDIHSDADMGFLPMACACKGDMNGNNRVNGDDIQEFVNCYILYAGGPLACPCLCADMNDDTVLTSVDVNQFITKLLTDPDTLCP